MASSPSSFLEPKSKDGETEREGGRYRDCVKMTDDVGHRRGGIRGMFCAAVEEEEDARREEGRMNWKRKPQRQQISAVNVGCWEKQTFRAR